jgi:GntR family transcriptional regulator
MTFTNIAEALPGIVGTPLHLQVKAAILRALTDGTWKPGDRLPTETELSRTFGVSEGTVRQAVIALVKEGRLTRRSGKGTFATRPNFDRSFARFFRFRGGTKNVEHAYTVELLKMVVETPRDPSILEQLALPRAAKVLAIHRAIRQDEFVVVHYVSYLSDRRFGSLRRKDIENAALYDVLESKYGVYIVRAVETLQARAARARDAAILGIKRAAPVIAIERLAYTYGDDVVEVRRAVGRSDNFRYEIELT